MKKTMLLLIWLFTFLIIPVEIFAQNDVLVLTHDTTVVSSQAKRLADKDSFFVHLNAMLTGYDYATFDSNSTLANLGNYKSVIIQETSFDATICRYLGQAGKTALKSWLMSGTSQDVKSVIILGGDLGYNYSRSASAGRDMVLSQTLLKWNYRVDNGSLTGQPSIEGVEIDAGNTRTMTTSPAGSGYYPDGMQPLSGGTTLYKYSGRGTADTVAAVGIVDTGYIGLSLFQDPRYFINGDFYEVLFALIQYAVNNGGTFPGFVPVELTSFAASILGTDVRLSWMTATELNNRGFDIERSNDQNSWEKIGFVEGSGTTTEMKYYSYTDKKLDAGKYFYRLKQVDFDGTYEYSSVVEAEITIPLEYALQQNYPNPFNPSTKINFSLAADSKVMLKIYDILGQEVTTLFNGDLSAGEHNLDFNASGLNSGVYLYRLDAQGVNGKSFSSVKKMILSK
jgi:hypothetical protein